MMFPIEKFWCFYLLDENEEEIPETRVNFTQENSALRYQKYLEDKEISCTMEKVG